MKKWILLLFLYPLLTAQILVAQGTGTITGQVTDQSGESLPSANIFIVEISKGAATDIEGNYTISNIPPGMYTLRVSYVGYQTFSEKLQVQAGENLVKDIQLRSGGTGLDELVVTGYGVQTKREVAGSITKLNSGDIQDVPLQNTESLLQGRAAGVQVTTSSGNPGGGFEVRVRGEGSINAGNAPLYIVDGVQISFSSNTELNDLSPLNSIRSEDIESIEVLKDASAAAIYGAQASNGVVLITTKRGQQGQTQISVNYETGFRATTRRYDLLNAQQWVDFQIEGFGESTTRAGLNSIYGYDEDVDFSTLGTFDWQDFIYREGMSQNLGFSASGGNDQTQFFISGGWENTEGQVRDVGFERYNLRTNFDHRFTEKLTASLNVNLSNTDAPGVCQDGFFVNCPFFQSAEEAPVSFPFIDADGNPVATLQEGGGFNPNTEQGSNNNPAVVFAEENRQTVTTQILGNISPNYNFTNWLSFNGLVGIDYRFVNETDLESPLADPGNDGSINRRFGTVTNFITNARLNARQSFSEVHNVSGLIGTEYRREFVDETEATSIGIGNRLLGVIDAAAEPSFNQGFNTEFRIASYFGAAKYNYDERYFVNLTGRFDGSSRFGSDNRWGFFPSASVAWRINEEDFFNAGFVDDLKLRASYGITGNTSGINDFASRGLFSVAGSYRGTTGITPAQLANNSLTWEEAREINLGVDYSFFRGRLSGSIDVYKRNNTDLLLARPLPLDSGFSSITENIGEVENRGIEFEVQSTNLNSRNFLWNTRFNIAIQKNEVLELSEGIEILDPDDDDPIAVGQSLEAFWMPRWAGVNPADGRPLWFDANGNLTYFPDTDDNVFLDGGEQDVIGGFGNYFAYKGLSLNVFFQFSFGQTVQPQSEFSFLTADFENALTTVLDRWQQPGDITTIPVTRSNGTGFFESASFASINSSNSLFDASYIRLKNITLSYNLPVSLVEKINLRGIRVYATGLNLMTWTAYPYLDPETVGNESSASFPTALQYNAGINLDF